MAFIIHSALTIHWRECAGITAYSTTTAATYSATTVTIVTTITTTTTSNDNNNNDNDDDNNNNDNFNITVIGLISTKLIQIPITSLLLEVTKNHLPSLCISPFSFSLLLIAFINPLRSPPPPLPSTINFNGFIFLQKSK